MLSSVCARSQTCHTMWVHLYLYACVPTLLTLSIIIIGSLMRVCVCVCLCMYDAIHGEWNESRKKHWVVVTLFQFYFSLCVLKLEAWQLFPKYTVFSLRLHAILSQGIVSTQNSSQKCFLSSSFWKYTLWLLFDNCSNAMYFSAVHPSSIYVVWHIFRSVRFEIEWLLFCLR